jgi:hypothetical protein
MNISESFGPAAAAMGGGFFVGILFGCLSPLLSISITGSQQDLKMKNILYTMQYQSLILCREELSII